MNLYTKVLLGFAKEGGLKLTVKVDVTSPGGISKDQIEQMKVALRELGVPDDVLTD